MMLFLRSQLTSVGWRRLLYVPGLELFQLIRSIRRVSDDESSRKGLLLLTFNAYS